NHRAKSDIDRSDRREPCFGGNICPRNRNAVRNDLRAVRIGSWNKFFFPNRHSFDERMEQDEDGLKSTSVVFQNLAVSWASRKSVWRWEYPFSHDILPIAADQPTS